ncbi:MAG: RNB domain-containing ribonuclease [Acidobacteriota bacterium]
MIPTPNSLEEDFQKIRDELKIPRAFPDAVLREAEIAASLDPRAPEAAARYADLLAVPFVTIDPPGSRDLDQAFFAERKGDGYLVRYAIADVGFFVALGGAIEHEAWRRGQTLYSPDIKTPLYPPALSEGGASLLPDELRPAIVFSFTLNAQGEVVDLKLGRAVVRSRVQLNYPEVSEHLAREREQAGSGSLARHEWTEALPLLEEIGRLRQKLEAARGGVSLRIPSQQVERWTMALTGYRLAFEMSSEIEDCNAQISLLTGMGAARMMIEHGVGLLRSLAPPRPDRLRSLRLTAVALGVNWPAQWGYADFVRSLDPLNPTHAVMLHQAARVTGGARYLAFNGEPPAHAEHAGLASFYAHATAPLRRLADRYVLDLLVALSVGAEPEDGLLAALARLPEVMAQADHLSKKLESALVDYVEARLMQERIGEVFNAIVIALRGDGVVVQIGDPPIRTLLPAEVFAPAGQQPVLSEDGATLAVGAFQVTLGQSLALRLEAADTESRRLIFTLA